MAKDLQKEFHAVRRQGDVAAINFLLENYEQNSRFVRTQLARLCTSERIAYAQEVAEQSQLPVEDASWLWYAYQEFSKLSERQKTKCGGFKGFVRTRADRDTALFERVASLTERKSEVEDTGYSRWNRTRRPHYGQLYYYRSGQLFRRSSRLEALQRGAAVLE